MAAAAFSRSRGVAGVRASKGLFPIFTLLCLVCFASSLTDKDQLEKLKEKLQKVQEDSDRLKAQYKSQKPSGSELMSESLNLMDQIITFYGDDPPMYTLLENTKAFMEKTKAYVDRTDEELGKKLEDNDEKLESLNKLIKFLEENQAEL